MEPTWTNHAILKCNWIQLWHHIRMILALSHGGASKLWSSQWGEIITMIFFGENSIFCKPFLKMLEISRLMMEKQHQNTCFHICFPSPNSRAAEVLLWKLICWSHVLLPCVLDDGVESLKADKGIITWGENDLERPGEAWRGLGKSSGETMGFWYGSCPKKVTVLQNKSSTFIQNFTIETHEFGGMSILRNLGRLLYP